MGQIKACPRPNPEHVSLVTEVLMLDSKSGRLVKKAKVGAGAGAGTAIVAAAAATDPVAADGGGAASVAPMHRIPVHVRQRTGERHASAWGLGGGTCAGRASVIPSARPSCHDMYSVRW